MDANALEAGGNLFHIDCTHNTWLPYPFVCVLNNGEVVAYLRVRSPPNFSFQQSLKKSLSALEAVSLRAFAFARPPMVSPSALGYINLETLKG
jgi:hypothetical protein